MSPSFKWPMRSSRRRLASPRARHSLSERSRYFSVTISRIGPTSCAMPPCTSTRLCWSLSRVSGETSSRAKDVMVGQQAAAADAEFRIAFPCQDAVDQFDSGPYAAGILPAAARAAQPFAQDGARGHKAAVLLFQAAGERVNLVRRAHAHGNEARREDWWKPPGAIRAGCHSPC